MELGVKQESYRVEVFMKNLQAQCFNVCCTSLSTNELTMDEVQCIDRCSWKYMEADKIFTKVMERGAAQVGAAADKKGKR